MTLFFLGFISALVGVLVGFYIRQLAMSESVKNLVDARLGEMDVPRRVDVREPEDDPGETVPANEKREIPFWDDPERLEKARDAEIDYNDLALLPNHISEMLPLDRARAIADRLLDLSLQGRRR